MWEHVGQIILPHLVAAFNFKTKGLMYTSIGFLQQAVWSGIGPESRI